MSTHPTSSLRIRPFNSQREEDYEAFCAVLNAVHPDHRHAASEMRERDTRQDPRCRLQRFLAEDSTGRAVGVAAYSQSTWAYHPDRYYTQVGVLPEEEGKGIGSALYRYLYETLTPLNPETLRTSIREDKDKALRFAEARGFTEEMREWESRLDVEAFDPLPFVEARRKAVAHGIIVRSLRQLENDPERDRKLWELESQTFRDVPSKEVITPPPFEQYQRQMLKSPGLLPDAFFIAIEEATGRYVGSSAVWKNKGDNDLHTGLTGVLRDFRRQGIALAMKLAVIDFAKTNGYGVIRTENATTNRPMLSINEALGFVKQPAVILMVNPLRPETPA